MWLLNKMLSAMVKEGHLAVRDYDGKLYHYGDQREAPVIMRLTDKGAALHIAKDPRVGAGEAYMDGRMVIEPPHDVRDMVLLVMRNANRGRGSIEAPSALRRGFDWVLAKADQINLRPKASSNVTHHYDLTRQFYELFLDENRLYTMAYFKDPANSLERAQLDKLALVAAKLRLVPGQCAGMRLLDIGCGWGGLGLYLNRHYGIEAGGFAGPRSGHVRQRARSRSRGFRSGQVRADGLPRCRRSVRPDHQRWHDRTRRRAAFPRIFRQNQPAARR